MANLLIKIMKIHKKN